MIIFLSKAGYRGRVEAAYSRLLQARLAFHLRWKFLNQTAR
jgi:hypothetical protein